MTEDTDKNPAAGHGGAASGRRRRAAERPRAEDCPPFGDCPLFAGIDPQDVGPLCDYLAARVEQVEKDVALYRFRQTVTEALYICAGTVSLELYDAWGHRSLINLRSNGFLMGDISLFNDDEQQAPYNLMTRTPCTVLMFSRARAHSLLADSGLPPGLETTARLFCYNLATLTADNLSKSLRRINLLAQHSVRDRISLFLSNHAEYHRARTFTVNMNRQQLADYLSIDRSTLCEELSKMRREGLIEYHLNTFTLL